MASEKNGRLKVESKVFGLTRRMKFPFIENVMGETGFGYRMIL